MVSRGVCPGLLGPEAPIHNHYYSKCSAKEPSTLTSHPILQLRKLRLKEENGPSHSAAAAAGAGCSQLLSTDSLGAFCATLDANFSITLERERL